MEKEKIYCPASAAECPYYNLKDGPCSIGEPWNECDDFIAFAADLDEYE